MTAIEQSYEAALRKVFAQEKADAIVITSRREKFQLDAANFGIAQGWLSGHLDERDEQSTAFVCRLTDAGREYFGLTKSEAA